MPTIHFVYKIKTKLKTSPSKLRTVTAPVQQQLQLEHIKSKFIKMTKTSQEAHSSRESLSQLCP